MDFSDCQQNEECPLFTYGKATRCDTLYVAILRLWKRIDEIGAD